MWKLCRKFACLRLRNSLTLAMSNKKFNFAKDILVLFILFILWHIIWRLSSGFFLTVYKGKSILYIQLYIHSVYRIVQYLQADLQAVSKLWHTRTHNFYHNLYQAFMILYKSNCTMHMQCTYCTGKKCVNSILWALKCNYTWKLYQL
jgi:hypothetical protein